MSLQTLPDEILLRVFACCSQNDRARSKRISKRMNTVLSNARCMRPNVDEFSVEMRSAPVRAAPLGRLQMNKSTKIKKRVVVTVRRSKKSKVVEHVSEEGPSGVDQVGVAAEIVEEELRKVHLGDRLNFDGVDAGSDFHKMLMQRWNNMSDVRSLSFNLSRVDWTEAQFAAFLQRTSIDSMNFDFCHLNPQMFTDKIFCSLSNFNIFRLQPRSPLYLPFLTDQTVRYWSLNPPQVIKMTNVMSHITLDGINELIQNVHSTREVEYDFGLIAPSPQNDTAFTHLLMKNGFKVSITNDVRSRRIVMKKDRILIVFNMVAQPTISQ